MELALFALVVVVLGGGYKLFTMNRENAVLKAERIEAKAAIRDVVPDLDSHLTDAQSFATSQDAIATAAENERLEALKLAGVKAEERNTALKLASHKRRNIDLI